MLLALVQDELTSITHGLLESNKKTRNTWLINQSQQHNYLNNNAVFNPMSFFFRFHGTLRLGKVHGTSWTNVAPKMAVKLEYFPHMAVADQLFTKNPPWIEPEAGWIFMANLTSWWLNHPSEKYARQIESFPQVGVKITNIWNHHLVEVADFFSLGILAHRTSEDEQGVYNHLRNARYLGSITILRRWLDP